jgi:hypothetical protein
MGSANYLVQSEVLNFKVDALSALQIDTLTNKFQGAYVKMAFISIRTINARNT